MTSLQLKLLIDLHKSNLRQGPGGEFETQKALDLAGLNKTQTLKIADIGCGTGTSSIQLAKELNAQITAVDLLPEFLNELRKRAEISGVSEKIKTLQCSMENLPFHNEEFDLIWSEGAIYNIGFEKGISNWKNFLKSSGKLIVSEITWLSADRPKEIQFFWDEEYPEIDTASAKIKVLESHGFSLEAYFYLPCHCWVENYFKPLQNSFTEFLDRNNHSEQAKEIVKNQEEEISLYEKYTKYYSYGFYIVEKI